MTHGSASRFSIDGRFRIVDAEVQIALLTARINDLTDHFKTHAKDHASRRGLLMMVSKRSSLLKYLRLHNRKSYLEVIGRLGIRK